MPKYGRKISEDNSKYVTIFGSCLETVSKMFVNSVQTRKYKLVRVQITAGNCNIGLNKPAAAQYKYLD